MNRTTCMQYAKRLALGLAALAIAATPSFAQTTYDLCVSDGTVNIGGDIVPIWGYADITGGGACTTGLATLPGPVLTAADGETLTINLSNALAVPVSIFIPGMAKTAGDPLSPVIGADGNGRERLVSLDETVAGTPVSFSWAASEGTYLYHSANDVRTQVPMGLYGALVVSGAGYPAVAAEQVLVFSEIDPALNANPAGFGGARVSTWNPQYFLINGATAPNVADIDINLSEDTLLRFVNAGLQTFVPTLGGLYMSVIAEDGNLYPYPLTQYGIELQAGKTIDAIVNAGSEGAYAIYDRSLHMANGGMLANIQAAPAAAAPVANPDGYSVAEDGTLTTIALDLTFPGVLDNDTGDAVAAVLVSGPLAGSLGIDGLVADGSFTYTPNADFFGSDEFTYVANDGGGGPSSNLATVTVTVTPEPDAPVAAPDTYDAIEGVTLSVAAPGVLENNTNVDGDAWTATQTGIAPPGSLLLNASGSFDYTPAGTAGATEAFEYQACNTSAMCSTATVTITIVAPVNNPPVANDDTTSMPRGTTLTNYDIIANDDDGEGNLGSPWIDGSSVVITTGGLSQRGGIVTNNGDGTINYTPRRPSFRGTDTFQYTVNDADGATSNVATVRINVVK